jgi:predicted metalloprotease with PDZ domain
MLLLGFLAHHKSENNEKSAKTASTGVNYPKSVQSIRLKLDPTEKPKSEKPKKIAKNKAKEMVKESPCEKFYYGIGYIGSIVADSKGQCSITSIAFNGPLHRAGVVPGDTIEAVEGNICPGRGETGSSLSVKVYHQGTPRTLLLQREKICEN